MKKRVPERLRREVKERARKVCEYCLIPEDATLFPHVPDHIIARKHAGMTRLDNRAWSCFLCNQLKGSDLASIDNQTGRIVRLFHPRKDRWKRHFRLEDGRIIPLSSIGRVTEFLLQFNHQQSLQTRIQLMRSSIYPP